jgi:hypothetical protein
LGARLRGGAGAMTRGRYGKGHIPSPPHKMGLGHPSTFLAAAPAVTSAAVPMPPVVDQLQTSSCTGNSSAVAIQEAMSKGAAFPPGQWAPLPSRLFLYYGARALEGSTGEDSGAMISDIFAEAARMGVPPESFWTFSEDLTKITAAPDWAAIRAAADQRIVTGAFRIMSSGQQRVADVKAAIASGSPVVWGTELDMAFEELGPTDVWPGVTGDVIGGHAMILHRFDGDVFWTRSSWGTGFADVGSARISAAAVASPNASDFWIVAMAPNYSGGVS